MLNTGSSADHEIVLPRDAENIIIRVGDTIVHEMRDGRVVTPASGAVAGSYNVDLSGLPRGGG